MLGTLKKCLIDIVTVIFGIGIYTVLQRKLKKNKKRKMSEILYFNRHVLHFNGLCARDARQYWSKGFRCSQETKLKILENSTNIGFFLSSGRNERSTIEIIPQDLTKIDDKHREIFRLLKKPDEVEIRTH